jgi:hypothetical protein
MGDMTNPTVAPIPRDAAKVLVRLPHSLHARLKVVAVEQGVSTNTLIAVLLAGGVGFKAVPRTQTRRARVADTTEPVTTHGGPHAQHPEH